VPAISAGTFSFVLLSFFFCLVSMSEIKPNYSRKIKKTRCRADCHLRLKNIPITMSKALEKVEYYAYFDSNHCRNKHNTSSLLTTKNKQLNEYSKINFREIVYKLFTSLFFCGIIFLC